MVCLECSLHCDGMDCVSLPQRMAAVDYRRKIRRYETVFDTRAARNRIPPLTWCHRVIFDARPNIVSFPTLSKWFSAGLNKEKHLPEDTTYLNHQLILTFWLIYTCISDNITHSSILKTLTELCQLSLLIKIRNWFTREFVFDCD